MDTSRSFLTEQSTEHISSDARGCFIVPGRLIFHNYISVLKFTRSLFCQHMALMTPKHMPLSPSNDIEVKRGT